MPDAQSAPARATSVFTAASIAGTSASSDQIAIDMHDGEELVLVDGSPDRARGLERVDRAVIVEVHQRRAECLADLIAAMSVHALDEQLGECARHMMRDDVVPVGQSSPRVAAYRIPLSR
jgi:hypothetical protein